MKAEGRNDEYCLHPVVEGASSIQLARHATGLKIILFVLKTRTSEKVYGKDIFCKPVINMRCIMMGRFKIII